MQLREGLLSQKPATVIPVAVCACAVGDGVGGTCTHPRQGSLALSLYTFPTNSI